MHVLFVCILQVAYFHQHHRIGPTRVPTFTRTLPLRLRRIRWAIITTTQVLAPVSATTQESHHTWPTTHTTRHHDRRMYTGLPGRCQAPPQAVLRHIHINSQNKQSLVVLVIIYILNLKQHCCFSFIIIIGQKHKSIFKPSYYMILHVDITIIIIIIRYNYKTDTRLESLRSGKEGL